MHIIIVNAPSFWFWVTLAIVWTVVVYAIGYGAGLEDRHKVEKE